MDNGGTFSGISIAIVFALILFVGGCGADRSASEQAPPAQPDAAKSAAAGQVPGRQEGAARQASSPAEARKRLRPSSGASGPAAPAAPEKAPGAAPVQAEQRREATVLAAGTVLKVRTTSALSTKTHKTGDVFEASLAEPVVSGGREVLPAGTPVQGRVVESDPGGRVKGVATLSLALAGITVGTAAVPISTNAVSQQAHASTKKDAAKVGIGAGIGAAIGAIAGGGKGAAIGAAAGGGAGTAAVLATRGDAAVVPAESVLTFQLDKAVTLP